MLHSRFDKKSPFGLRTAWSALGFTVGLLALAPLAQAQAGRTMFDFKALPPTLPNSSPPLVMLAMSNDNHLFVKAYSDYSDLDDDGALDTTYKDSFEYYGYFDPDICYQYDSANGLFKPVKAVQTPGTNHICPDISTTPGGAPWSGNFLNWATMTRMDVVRRVLYGGKRYTDPAAPANGNVILERALLPPDVHAFAKVYSETDLANFTPYTYSSVALPGITLCNVTDGPSGGTLSKDVDTGTYPPQFRVAYGAWADWSADERRQCVWNTNAQDFSPDDTDDVAGGSDGASSTKVAFNVRVEVCVDGVDTTAEDRAKKQDRCRDYPNGNIKPYGLLQEWGESGELRFGLMTGSYEKNTKGGVLRKNIGLLAGNDAADADQDEIDLATGQFINQGTIAATGRTYEGIINTLNRLRISQWEYNGNSSVYDDCSSPGITISDFLDENAGGGKECRDWGNPISEIYAEALRYFSGAAAPTSAFNADDSGHINALPQINTWVDPFEADGSNACANCAIIVLSTGLGSFDADDDAFSGITGLGNRAALDTKTDAIGALEIPSGSYFVGSNGVTNDGLCTAKPIDHTNYSLSDVLGFCPELPELRGGYDIVGLAYHGHTTDLRTGTNFDGEQSVTTYTVQLAESLPEFAVDVDGSTVSFVPLCRAVGGGSDRQCTMVNVEVVDQTDTIDNSSGASVSDGKFDYGKFFITWEDSSWGNDYDMDIKQQLEYCIGAACSPAVANNQIKMTTDAVSAAAGHVLRLGWIMSGTTEDGIIDYDGDGTAGENADDFQIVDSPDPKQVTDAPAAIDRTYTAGTAAASTLKNPLWYAAKYGSFERDTGNLLPTGVSDWDALDANRQAGSDGVPDSFFPVKNPALLELALSDILGNIGDNVASSTSAAVVSNSSRGAGAIYQAVYYPKFQVRDPNDPTIILDSISWAGSFHALFVDNDNSIREDTNGNSILDDKSTDYVVEIAWDPTADNNRGHTMVKRFKEVVDNSTNPATTYMSYVDTIRFEELNTIWNARDQLVQVTDVTTQRAYGDRTDDGRYIFTWLDRNGDGAVDEDPLDPATNEVLPFEPASFPAAAAAPADADNFRWLGIADPNDAADIINWVRGDESIPGARSRTIDFDGDGVEEPWLLSDIVHSSPVIVGEPQPVYGFGATDEDARPYDVKYGDSTYQAFRQKYENRRQVAYVGSNGGLLHAFNAGFFKLDPVYKKDANGDFVLDNNGDKVVSHYLPKFDTVGPLGTEQSHPLGGEIWAYAPYNLLPHLKWLQEERYPHLFYVDGSIKAYDVNIFEPSAVHPNGWGTILVVGMRLGGAPYQVDTDGDSVVGGSDFTGRSAYIILDVTDPEQPPTLIAELTPANLGYTTGVPTIVKQRAPAGGSYPDDPLSLEAGEVNQWFLVFGNGPTDGESATSANASSVYAYDLVNRAMVTLDSDVTSGVAETGSFMGNFLAEDWNNDFKDDVVYVGTVGGSVFSPTGKLKRIKLVPGASQLGLDSGAEANTLHDTGRPIVASPNTYTDSLTGDRWVTWGTGRYFVPADTESTATQGYYGVKEPLSSGSYNFDQAVSSLVDTTDIEMAIENTLRMADGSAVPYSLPGSPPVPVTTFEQLKQYITAYDGWYRDFPVPERNFSDTFQFHTAMMFVTYAPVPNQCVVEGNSYLWALSVFTGTAAPFRPIGQEDNQIFDSLTGDPDEALEKKWLGTGVHTPPVDGITQDDKAGLKPVELTPPELPHGRQSWREIRVDF